MAHPGIAGEHHQLRRVLDQAWRRQSGVTLTECDDRLAVGDPRAAAQHYRRIESLGEVEGQPGELLALLGVGRLEHRQLGELGIVAAVLLVLRGVHLRVVGGHQDQAAAHPGVGKREQRVGRHVDADMLHAGNRPGSRRRRRRSPPRGQLSRWVPRKRRSPGSDRYFPGFRWTGCRDRRWRPALRLRRHPARSPRCRTGRFWPFNSSDYLLY